MGKIGPCYHCGVTSTPLWRNGPPDKPVLCNACGSRWRTKGSLTNYTPLHARGPLEHLDDFKVSKEKNTLFKPKDQKLHKIKVINGNADSEIEIADYGQNFHRALDEDISNRSSSGSAVSYSESCVHFGASDVTDVSGTLQPTVLDSLVPSKKRTDVTRPKASSVEKLTKDLHSILHQQSSYLSELSEEDLLYENGNSNGSVEIGNGSILIRHPNMVTLEEESEASSLPIKNIPIYSGLPIPVHMRRNGPTFSDINNEKERTHTGQEHVKRDRISQEKFHILRDRDSEVGFLDLQDIVNYEGLMQHLTYEEQQSLLKYLPSTDTVKLPESIRCMFTSPQFQETLHSFQMLLQEGVFDLTLSGVSEDECRTLKRLVLLNTTKSSWVEHHKMLKDAIHKSFGEKGVGTGTNILYTSNSAKHKRPRERQNQNFQEVKVIKNPKKLCKSVAVNLVSTRSPKLTSGDTGTNSVPITNGYMDNDGSSSSPRSFFACHSDKSSIWDSLQLTNDSPDEDLLIDVRSNNSFPEAELLSDLWKIKAVPNNSSEVVAEKEGCLL